MKTTKATRTAAATLMAGTTALLLALTGCTATGPSPTPATTKALGKPATVEIGNARDRFAILHRPFASTDALPQAAVSFADDIVVNSQRRAGSSGRTTYWIAEKPGGGACLLSLNPDPDSPDNYSICGGGKIDKGTVVTSMSDERGHLVALTSDGYASRGADPLRRIAENVWAN